MSNQIKSSSALHPSEWYSTQINKAYNDIKTYKALYYEALGKYNKRMAYNTRLGYSLNKVSNFANRVKLTKEWKKDYKVLEEMYKKCVDIYCHLLGSYDLLDSLKAERETFNKTGEVGASYEQSRK